MRDWYCRKLSASPNYWGKQLVGPDVDHVQRALAAPLTGTYDESTEQRVRGVQYAAGLPITGVVDVPTALAIDALTKGSIT